MKRLSLVPALCLVGIAACSDNPTMKGMPGTTAPARPRLTASNLPADASTICTSAVLQRDHLTKALNGLTEGHREQKLASLDALVEDSCY